MGAPAITGVILAGGLGRRMGGVDKGLQLLAGRPLAAHVAARLGPQVDELLINANQNAAAYAALGYPVVADRIAGFAGPLAGLHTALSVARHPLVVTAPCDSPFLPADLVARLAAALADGGHDIAIARSAERIHPVFCLCQRSLAAPLGAFLAAGHRRFSQWLDEQRTVEVSFPDEAAFANINTAAELALLAPRN
ncbi:MAG: molybdenum cofactor guanylyltransferase [Azonexus sp.]|jgi:molybdopterin-guanine dinucleotide biosynthesis protein A|uniref:molybdenum cofactor guanylyltransferase MobA n=1 Tax=Azonexus sp. TaxID=1872668 RepID=UPI00281D39AF|nr:molybdenum cofactor guanylyltransferase MobA [Azonexus sp.]MDR0775922.1 molybdenum cofactor guanylyltransferase [Azonexus sp.]